MLPSDPGPPHIAACWLEAVSYTSASIDWLPLNTNGTIAPVDAYILEVSRGAETVQRIKLSGTVGLHPLVLPDVLQPHASYNATLFGNNSAGRGPPCHVSFATNEGLHLEHVYLWYSLSMHGTIHWGLSLHQVSVYNLPAILYRELLAGCHRSWCNRVTIYTNIAVGIMRC